MREQITLCAKCAGNYRIAGYFLWKDYSNPTKEVCDICSRAGWVYWIEREKPCR